MAHREGDALLGGQAVNDDARNDGAGAGAPPLPVLAGVAIVIGVAGSWVGATQLTESTYSASFHAPFFNVWISTALLGVTFPGFVLVQYALAARRGHRGPAPGLAGAFQAAFRECAPELTGRLPGPAPGVWEVIQAALPFLLLWMGANYCYVRALASTSATDVTAIFSATPAFVYLLSFCLLGDAFSPLRLLAVLLAVAGLVLVAVSGGVDSAPNLLGAALTLAASACAAVYKVWLKRVVGNASVGAIALLLTTIATLNTLLLWVVWLILLETGAEPFTWATAPWKFLLGSATLGVVFNFLLNFGIALTYPLFISVGTVVGIPVNALVDHFVRHLPFNAEKLGGCALIVAAFLMLTVQWRVQPPPAAGGPAV